MGRRLQTLAAVSCMKIFLMIFNLIFWLTGIGILAVGIWMKISMFKYLQLSEDYNDVAPYVLIGTGSAIIIVGSMACCCTMKGQSFMLYLYSLFLIIVFLAMLAVGISGYMFRSKIEKGFKRGLHKAMESYKSSDESTDGKILDRIQSNLGCCGVNSYSDWFNVTWTEKQNSVPVSCCKHQNKDCLHFNIGINGTDTIYSAGCYQKVFTFVDSNYGIIGGAIISIAFFQILGMLLSYCLARNVNKGKYEPVN